MKLTCFSEDFCTFSFRKMRSLESSYFRIVSYLRDLPKDRKLGGSFFFVDLIQKFL